MRSPTGLGCYFADITHEMAFTPGSFEEMLFCHDLKLVSLRHPWPVPLGMKRTLYYLGVRSMRAMKAFRLRCLGFQPPRIWSDVMWALAAKK